jgi:2-polyprenyl-6-methoxyphenol hydroxylase-like FAD-dependent oxidoreductase
VTGGSEAEIPVLIVGGGPVGLALSVELALSGIACTLIERRDGKVTVPKSSNLSGRIMEFNRRWGIARKVAGAGWPLTFPNDRVYCTSMVGPELGREPMAPYTELKFPHTPEPPCGCVQSYYDPILFERARSLPLVTMRIWTNFESLTQDEHGVSAVVLDDSGRREVILAKYLVGCDGGGSTVRKAIGVDYEGAGVISSSCNIYFRSDALGKMHDKGWARIYRFTDEGGSWGELIACNGNELWRLTVFKRLSNHGPDDYLRRLAGAEFPYEILSVMDWERRDAVAHRYRDRRVFIAGDAAHQNSPTGGLGLHTGLGDVVDLAWKLLASLRGWGGAELLDSYEAERKPVGILNVRESTAMFDLLTGLPGAPGIGEDSPRGTEARRTWGEAFRRAGNGNTPGLTDNLRFGYCYEPSPIVIADGSTKPPQETPKFVATARSGTRAPHAWLDSERSTLDLFGSGFVLLRFGGAPDAQAMVDAAGRVGMPFRVVDIPDPQIAALYERKLVLVRPDGHVAWRGDVLPTNPAWVIDRVRGQTSPSAS